jgi:hypothetical protein
VKAKGGDEMAQGVGLALVLFFVVFSKYFCYFKNMLGLEKQKLKRSGPTIFK